MNQCNNDMFPKSEAAKNDGISSLYDRDPLFEEAAAFVVSGTSTATTSSLQRRYSIGYNRAGKIMDQIEAAGIVGPSNGGMTRKVLVTSIELIELLNDIPSEPALQVPQPEITDSHNRFPEIYTSDKDEYISILEEKIKLLEERLAEKEKLINALLKIDIPKQTKE